MSDENPNSTDATRGQPLRVRVETRKRELELVVEKLDPSDREFRDVVFALQQVEGLLTGDPDNTPHVVLNAMNTWLERNKHLAERHRH